MVPASRVVRNSPQPADPLPWWVIVVPIIAAIIIITVVAVLLWVVSLFLSPLLIPSISLYPLPSLSVSPSLSLYPLPTFSQFGFFRRRKHEEIKQRREELQTLNDHGVTPAGASVDSIGNSNIEHISVGADKGGRDF